MFFCDIIVFKFRLNTAHTIFKFRLSKQRAFFSRSHKHSTKNLLSIAPRGSKQGVFRALTQTEKNAV